METKIKCAAILSRLSLHKRYYPEFTRDDVLRVLLDLAAVDHTLTQRRVVIAISNLTQSEDIRKMLLHLDATKVLKSLGSKPDEDIRLGSMAIVCNLAYETGTEEDMIKAKIVPTLLVTSLVTSGNFFLFYNWIL